MRQITYVGLHYTPRRTVDSKSLLYLDVDFVNHSNLIIRNFKSPKIRHCPLSQSNIKIQVFKPSLISVWVSLKTWLSVTEDEHLCDYRVESSKVWCNELVSLAQCQLFGYSWDIDFLKQWSSDVWIFSAMLILFTASISIGCVDTYR